MASPLRSPFKSIANCVSQVLTWSSKNGEATEESIKSRKPLSRSVSPEIPKVDEPRQFTLKDEENMGSNSRPKRSRSSAPQTPRTPPSGIVKSLAFDDDSQSPKRSTRKSTRVRSTTTTPLGTPQKVAHETPKKTPKSKVSTPSRQQTPKGTPRSLRLNGSKPSTPKCKTENTEVTPEKGRRSSRARNTPKARDIEASDDDKDKDFEPEDHTPSKRRTSTRVRNTPKAHDTSDEDSEDDFKPAKTTPSKRRGPARALGFTKDEELNSRLLKTPKRRKSSIEAVAHRDTPAKRRRTMTPRVPARTVPLAKNKCSLEEAQLRLHVGAVPDSLPCREDEFAQILSFTEGKIFDGTGGCMYISGVPGTGKTATVKEVLRTLQSSSDDGELPSFQFIEINGMRLTEPNQLYSHLWKSLTGAKVTTEHAKNLLEKRFTSPTSGKKNQTLVVLVDELDLLWNRKQSVLYNIFEWPNNPQAKLVILAIANTMDLPERVMINRVASRIGLTRLTFSPYTHDQLKEIVSARLSGLTVFDKDAIQLVARKVASLSGDARRALDICRRATEIAQMQGPKTLVTIQHVTDAHKEMFCSPKIMAIRHCSKYEKVFLQAIVAVFQKIGIEEAPFDRVLKTMNEVLKFENLDMLAVDEAHNVVGRLAACRLVLAEPGKTGRLDMKLRLNVSQDDVMFALKEDA